MRLISLIARNVVNASFLPIIALSDQLALYLVKNYIIDTRWAPIIDWGLGFPIGESR